MFHNYGCTNLKLTVEAKNAEIKRSRCTVFLYVKTMMYGHIQDADVSICRINLVFGGRMAYRALITTTCTTIVLWLIRSTSKNTVSAQYLPLSYLMIYTQQTRLSSFIALGVFNNPSLFINALFRCLQPACSVTAATDFNYTETGRVASLRDLQIKTSTIKTLHRAFSHPAVKAKCSCHFPCLLPKHWMKPVVQVTLYMYKALC